MVRLWNIARFVAIVSGLITGANFLVWVETKNGFLPYPWGTWQIGAAVLLLAITVMLTAKKLPVPSKEQLQTWIIGALQEYNRPLSEYELEALVSTAVARAGLKHWQDDFDRALDQIPRKTVKRETKYEKLLGVVEYYQLDEASKL